MFICSLIKKQNVYLHEQFDYETNLLIGLLVVTDFNALNKQCKMLTFKGNSCTYIKNTILHGWLQKKKNNLSNLICRFPAVLGHIKS
ncbi:hypothetical protein GDO86_010565 [Hymenochirus boettgeri]|uniref:Uncharacterized protein n=1 Tax=Hymenochirus boettgeri TaxID=247094 RepID=A0A8T2JQV0_9PIPI|nr:hypothetical protein GDO86_010565 [Hymenochirus boettgeri]